MSSRRSGVSVLADQVAGVALALDEVAGLVLGDLFVLPAARQVVGNIQLEEGQLDAVLLDIIEQRLDAIEGDVVVLQGLRVRTPP